MLSALLLGGAWLYWRLPLGGAAIGAVLIAGVAYGLLLIATHELVHGTLMQLYATRNINAGSWLNALMGGLPHHGAPHAFPSIPSERLPLATRRIALVLERHSGLSCSAWLPPSPAPHGPEGDHELASDRLESLIS
jgi:fatty acid desaturase